MLRDSKQPFTTSPDPGGKLKLDGKQEALLVALACSQPDERESWTMQLLADKLVELKVVDEISDETVQRTLKKTTSNPGRSNNDASAEVTADFVRLCLGASLTWRMEIACFIKQLLAYLAL